MRFTFLTPAMLLSLLFGFTVEVQAAHTTCSWKPIPEGNTAYEEHFRLWCTATRSDDNVYRCGQDAVRGAGSQVADWGKLAPDTLEFATPCGDGGYAGHHQSPYNTCYAFQWLVCMGSGPPTSAFHDCYGLGDKDDCQWPTEMKTPPDMVRVYWRIRNRYDTTGHFRHPGHP